MTVFLGLTGSIGMGKSTTAAMFREAGIPVHDSDTTVHALYQGEAARLVEAAFPGTTAGGTVDRGLLGKQVIGNEAAMRKLEAIIHPLVWREEKEFRKTVKAQNLPLAIIDNPLLFEAGRQNDVDAVIVVTAPAEVQRERVLARPGMDPAKFKAILDRQVPDAVKRSRADFIIDTSRGLDAAREDVLQIIEKVKSRDWKPKDKSDA